MEELKVEKSDFFFEGFSSCSKSALGEQWWKNAFLKYEQQTQEDGNMQRFYS